MSDKGMPTKTWSLKDATPFQKWSIIFTGLIFFVTAIYSIFSFLQWKELNTAQQQFQATQRAFVHLNGFRTTKLTDTRKKKVISCQIIPIFQNSGATPTRNMTVHVSFFQTEKPIPENFDYPDLGDCQRIPFYLAPHMEQETGAITVPIKTIADVRNHTLDYYIYGWIRYKDIVGGGNSHLTEFCYGISEVLGDPMGVTDPMTLRFSECPKHNCADEECNNQ